MLWYLDCLPCLKACNEIVFWFLVYVAAFGCLVNVATLWFLVNVATLWFLVNICIWYMGLLLMLGYLGSGKCCGSCVVCRACSAYLEAAVAGDPEYKVGQTRDHPKDSKVGQQAQ